MRRSLLVCSPVVVGLVSLFATVTACVNQVDKASYDNASAVQSHEDQDERIRKRQDKDGGMLNTPVGVDNYNLASDAGRR